MTSEFADIDDFRVISLPAGRCFEFGAIGHNPHTGKQIFSKAVCVTEPYDPTVKHDPLFTLSEVAAFNLLREMCKAFADDFSVLEFNAVNLSMKVKPPAHGGGRFIPAGERTPAEVILEEKVAMLERLIEAKDENLADLRGQVTYTYADPNVPLTISKLEEGF